MGKKQITNDLAELKILAEKSYNWQENVWEMPFAMKNINGEPAIVFNTIKGLDNLVFHYTSLETFKEKILQNNSLLLNRAEKSKDPIESRWVFDDFGRGAEINEKMKKCVRFTCFCRPYAQIDDEKIPGYALSRMWNQYGDSFKGVCLGFNYSILKQLVNDQYPSRNRTDEIRYTIDLNPEKVCHTFKAYGLDKDNIFFDEKGSANKWNIFMIEKLFGTDLFGLYCHKAKDYRDENEIRISVYNDNTEDCFIKKACSGLEMIIVGDLVSDDVAREIDLSTNAIVYMFGYKSPYRFAENCVNLSHTESFGHLRRISTKESIRYKIYRKIISSSEERLTVQQRKRFWAFPL